MLKWKFSSLCRHMMWKRQMQVLKVLLPLHTGVQGLAFPVPNWVKPSQVTLFSQVRRDRRDKMGSSCARGGLC